MTRGLHTVVAIAIGLVIAIAAPRPARAGDDDTIVHKVKPGDTLELLAAEYYGDRNHAVFLMVANHMLHPRPLKPNERLRIPVSREITTAVGDTFETLAQAYLGDARRGPFLAEFNGLTPDDSLAAGTVISVPFTVTHTSAGDEGLDAIAAAYFGDARQGKLLRAYNFLDKDVLSAGESIIVPIHHVRVRESKLPPVDAESKARSDRRHTIEEQAAAALPGARLAWRASDYATVKRDLIPIDTDYLGVREAVEIGLLLGGAFVASGDADSALATFKRVLERRPKQTLSPYWYSPRVTEVWQRAGGTVEAE